MINGLSSNSYPLLQPDRQIQREQAGYARPDSRNPAPAVDPSTPRDTVDPKLLERRVQARQAAEDARLERFRADEVPLRNAQALDVFTGIASQRDDGDVELAGIDIRV